MKRCIVAVYAAGVAVLIGCAGENRDDESLADSRETVERKAEPSSPVAGADRRYLTRVEPTLVPSADSSFWFQEGISDSLAEMISDLLPAAGVRWPRIYQLPGTENRYLVAGREVQGDQNAFDGGLRFFLIRLLEERLEIASRTRGAMDSYYLEPVFFAEENAALILADTGAEYAWGLMAFEYADDQLRDLGGINVAKAPEDAFETSVSPLGDAKVQRTADSYIVEFYCDILFDPGGRNHTLLERDGEAPFVFMNQDGEFTLVSD